MGKCEKAGCQNPATRSFWLDYDTVVSVCEQHYRELEEERRKKEEETKREEERRKAAMDEARRLLSLDANEINFERKCVDKDDDSINYVGLGKRVPREVYVALVQAGAMKKCFDDEVNQYYYPVDEAKATPILQKFGFKVISLKEWQERLKQAEELLKQVGLSLAYLRSEWW
jgi:hypothetical protein